MKELKEGIEEYCNSEQGYDSICNAYECDFERFIKQITEICTTYIKGKEELISIFLEPYIKSHYQKSDVKDLAKDIINILIGGGK